MRFSGRAAVAVLMTGSLAGCTAGDGPDDGPGVDPVPAEALAPPENLCDLVPMATVERWRLEEEDHRRSDRQQHTKWASCAMAGVDGDGETVLLSARITTYGDLGDPGFERMSDAVTDACDDLRLSTDGSFTSDDAGCGATAPVDAEEATEGGTTIFRRAEASAGKVQVQVSHRGPQAQDVVTDAEAVADALVLFTRG